MAKCTAISQARNFFFSCADIFVSFAPGALLLQLRQLLFDGVVETLYDLSSKESEVFSREARGHAFTSASTSIALLVSSSSVTL